MSARQAVSLQMGNIWASSWLPGKVGAIGPRHGSQPREAGRKWGQAYGKPSLLLSTALEASTPIISLGLPKNSGGSWWLRALK